MRLRVDKGLALIGQGPDQLILNNLVSAFFHNAKTDANRFRFGHNLQRIGQFCRIAGGAEGTAGLIGKALQLGLVLRVGNVKSDHMRGEINARFFQLATHFAGVQFAGFAAIRHQNDGGLFLGVFQGFGGLNNSRG